MKQSEQNMYKVLMISLIAITLSFVPYIYGYICYGSQFKGVLSSGGDPASYLMWMRQARDGRWLFSNYYTTIPHRALFFNPMWLLLGYLARLSGLSLVLVFHIARFVCSLALLFAIYKFLSVFLERERAVFGFLMVVLTGGFGWVFVVLQILVGRSHLNRLMSMDLYALNAHVFFSLLTYPHISISITLLLLSLMCFVKGVSSPSPSLFGVSLVGTVMGGLVLGFIHPYDVVLLWAVLFMYTLLLWRVNVISIGKAIFYLGTSILVSLLSIIYQAYVFLESPVFKVWNAQNIIRSPSLVAHLLGYGWLVPFTVTWFWYVVIKRQNREYLTSPKWLLLVSWIITVPVIASSYPFIKFEGKLTIGYTIPLTILAVDALFKFVLPRARYYTLFSKPREIRWAVILSILFLMTFPTTAFLVVDNVRKLKIYPDKFCFTTEEVEGFQYLDSLSQVQAINVFASKEIGEWLPSMSGARVFVGHKHLSVKTSERLDQLKLFFSDSCFSLQGRVQLLRDFRINYIWYGRNERSLGQFSPSNLPGVQEILGIGEGEDMVQIFHVDVERNEQQ